VPIDPSQAYDLSRLQAQPPEDPAQTRQRAEETPTYTCTVENGCGFTCRGTHPHETLDHCLATALPYVAMYLEVEEASYQLVELVKQLQQERGILLDANSRLALEKNRLTAELREARRGTPAAEKSVLAGAADLAASMKANFGTTQGGDDHGHGDHSHDHTPGGPQ